MIESPAPISLSFSCKAHSFVIRKLDNDQKSSFYFNKTLLVLISVPAALSVELTLGKRLGASPKPHPPSSSTSLFWGCLWDPALPQSQKSLSHNIYDIFNVKKQIHELLDTPDSSTNLCVNVSITSLPPFALF